MTTVLQSTSFFKAAALALAALGLPLLGACVSSRPFLQAANRELVWPPPPSEPRVRFLGEISGDLIGSNGQSKLQELLYGTTPAARLVTPHGVSVDQGGTRVAIADPNAHCVHILNMVSNEYVRVDRAGDVFLEAPVGVAWGTDALYLSDPPRNAVESYSVDGNRVTHQQTMNPGVAQRPAGLAFDYDHTVLLVCDSHAHQIHVWDARGTAVRTMGKPGSSAGELRFPAHVACAPDGSIVVSDAMNFRVQRFSNDGAPLDSFGRKGDAAGDIALPKGIAADSKGNLWVVDAQFENVQAFTAEGQLLLAFGGEGHASGEFWLPSGACIDRQDRLWIADTYNRRIQVFQLMP